MGGVGSISALRPDDVRPLRRKAPVAEGKQVFDIEALKNGGSFTIRDQYRGGAPAPSARRAQNSQLSKAEQVKKLGQIRKSAVEYESVFVDQLVKQMRQPSLAKTPGGDTLSDIAEQPFRDFLSQNGGIGLADTIVNQVARQEGLEQTLQENPGIMGPNWRPTVPPNLMKKPAGGLTMEAAPAGNIATGLVGGPPAAVRAMLAGAENFAGLQRS